MAEGTWTYIEEEKKKNHIKIKYLKFVEYKKSFNKPPYCDFLHCVQQIFVKFYLKILKKNSPA